MGGSPQLSEGEVCLDHKSHMSEKREVGWELLPTAHPCAVPHLCPVDHVLQPGSFPPARQTPGSFQPSGLTFNKSLREAVILDFL